MPASQEQPVILVTGGTGKIGTCVSNLLASAAVPHLVASRCPPPGAGPHVVQFDWLDRATWDRPFTTTTTTTTTTTMPVSAVFLLAPPVAECSPIMNDFVDHARTRYAARRFVLLGATAVEPGGPVMGGTARHLAELGGRGEIQWAVLRPSWFQENWSEQDNIRKTVREEGKCYSAAGDGKIPWISKHDIAACAVHALTAERSVDGDLILLGPELLSYDDCANVLTEVTGKRIIHESLSSEDLVARLSRDLGLPEAYSQALAAMDLMIKRGGEEKTNDVVLSVTGKKPRTFRDFAEENKAVWI